MLFSSVFGLESSVPDWLLVSTDVLVFVPTPITRKP
nr:MAG TPA: hypothetical protein [Caudoviricetes sp.]